MKNHSRNVKVGVIVVTVAILCAIILPVTLKFAKSQDDSSTNSSTLSGTTQENNVGNNVDNMEGEDSAQIPIEPCPCFDASELEGAAANLIGSSAANFKFNKVGTCTGSGDTGILYSSPVDGNFVEDLGYRVSTQYNECGQHDAMQEISDSEAIVCRELIETTCSDHKEAFDAMKIIVPDHCPCFDASDLEGAVSDLAGPSAADFEFNPFSSCTGEDRDGISYSRNPSGMPEEAHGYGVDTQSNLCTQHDAVRMITEPQADTCKQLIDETCSKHKEALNALSALVDECPCFKEEELKLLIGQVKAGGIKPYSTSCSGPSLKTISWNLDSDGPFPDFMAYGTSSFENDFYCQRHDMIRDVTEQEMNICSQLVDSACSELNL